MPAMKPMRFILTSPDVARNALSAVSQAPTDGTVEMLLGPVRARRNLAQNALYWAWLAQIEDVTGIRAEEPEEDPESEEDMCLHDRFRRTYLAKIYLADPQNRPQAQWVSARWRVMELIKELDAKTGREALAEVDLLVSTTWATVEQFSEYLRRIENFCFSKEIPLGRTDDYMEAMGLRGNSSYTGKRPQRGSLLPG